MSTDKSTSVNNDSPKPKEGMTQKDRFIHFAGLALRATYAIGRSAAQSMDKSIENLTEELGELGPAQSEKFDEQASELATRYSQLSSLSSEERERIESALIDAQRDILIEKWRRAPLDNLAVNGNSRIAILIFITPGILFYIFAIPLALQMFKFGLPSAIASLCLLVIILIVCGIASTFRFRKTIVALSITFVALYTFGSSPKGPSWAQAWLTDLQALLYDAAVSASNLFNWSILRSINWPNVGMSTAGWLMLAAWIWWAIFGLRFIVWISTWKHVIRPHSSQLAISKIILDLAKIAHALEELNTESPTASQYAASRYRTYVINLIERAAETVEDIWFRSLRVGHKESDRELLMLSAGIAQALRRWKPKVALGANNIESARTAFALAVLNACDGDWELMSASNVEAPRRSYRRILRGLVRLILLIVPAGMIFASSRFATMLPSGVSVTITTACSVIFVAQLMALLDPSSGSRYESSIKILELSKK
ncbi:hypothetical protein [Streptosporangium sandarakinum]